MKTGKFLALLFTVVFLSSCSKTNNPARQEYLIFGHFYGMCGGEECIETFKLTDDILYEDIEDDYSKSSLIFNPIGNDKFEIAKDLREFIPAELLNETDQTFGCPDCNDQGGIYIQYSTNGKVHTWRLDQNKSDIPSYLHAFTDKVNEKIGLINN